MKKILYPSTSQFKLAVRCSTMFSYKRKHKKYKDSIPDDVIVMLPEGGYQVGGIAKKPYPDGVAIEY
jgi:hypothetical protein